MKDKNREDETLEHMIAMGTESLDPDKFQQLKDIVSDFRRDRNISSNYDMRIDAMEISSFVIRFQDTLPAFSPVAAAARIIAATKGGE